MKNLIALFCVMWAVPVGAASFSEAHWLRITAAEVVVLGEIHDNPDHHAVQAQVVQVLHPAAVVWEMLTPDKAGLVTGELAGDASALGAILDWEASGWPDFAMYAPIFAANPSARVYGAQVTRAAIRQAIESDPIAIFGDEAVEYGLTQPLPRDQRAARMALQFEAHCQALPSETLEPMVDIQRVRDAVIARAVLQALDETGGPVAVITGNGHARRDWGVPSYLARVRPGLDVFVLGQTEANARLEGGFDHVISAQTVDRPDPCAAFK